MTFPKSILALLSAGLLSGGAVSAEEQTLRFKLVVSFTSDAEMQLASVPDRSLAAHEAVGVAFFEDGRVAFKQFVISTAGGAEDGSYIGLSTYTFENGDSLTLKFTGGWTPEGQGGDYEVLSGTGAFEGATGTGRFDGLAENWEDADLLEGSFTLDVPAS
jgi:hypothetical protein